MPMLQLAPKPLKWGRPPGWWRLPPSAPTYEGFDQHGVTRAKVYKKSETCWHLVCPPTRPGDAVVTATHTRYKDCKAAAAEWWKVQTTD